MSGPSLARKADGLNVRGSLKKSVHYLSDTSMTLWNVTYLVLTRRDRFVPVHAAFRAAPVPIGVYFVLLQTRLGALHQIADAPFCGYWKKVSTEGVQQKSNIFITSHSLLEVLAHVAVGGFHCQTSVLPQVKPVLGYGAQLFHNVVEGLSW